MHRAAACLLPVLLALSLSADAPGAGRTIVGRKLPDVTFTDLGGHTLSPGDYEGSVLVMFAGIPW